MPGFYEILAHNEKKEPLQAVWLVEGEAAGAKALYSARGLLCCDTTFPSALANTGNPHTW